MAKAVEIRMHKAVAAFLKSIGWKPLVTGPSSIAKVGPIEMKYEFRVAFLGRKVAPKSKPAPKKKPK